ncbi:PaaI family thioesterase [Tepidicaulis marinus]|nr:PaaI family thioesterase [Tepidicaulis marinus]
MTRATKPVMSAAEVDAYLAEVFPQMQEGERGTRTEEVGPMRARLRLSFAERNLRPGGTISGPAMMGLADHAMYAAILAHIGKVALAVTTNLTINFMRKPAPGDLLAEARIMKLGQRLAVGDVTIWSEGEEGRPAAHAQVTYSIPPEKP